MLMAENLENVQIMLIAFALFECLFWKIWEYATYADIFSTI